MCHVTLSLAWLTRLRDRTAGLSESPRAGGRDAPPGRRCRRGKVPSLAPALAAGQGVGPAAKAAGPAPRPAGGLWDRARRPARGRAAGTGQVGRGVGSGPAGGGGGGRACWRGGADAALRAGRAG